MTSNTRTQGTYLTYLHCAQCAMYTLSTCIMQCTHCTLEQCNVHTAHTCTVHIYKVHDAHCTLTELVSNNKCKFFQQVTSQNRFVVFDDVWSCKVSRNRKT